MSDLQTHSSVAVGRCKVEHYSFHLRRVSSRWFQAWTLHHRWTDWRAAICQHYLRSQKHSPLHCERWCSASSLVWALCRGESSPPSDPARPYTPRRWASSGRAKVEPGLSLTFDSWSSFKGIWHNQRPTPVMKLVSQCSRRSNRSVSNDAYLARYALRFPGSALYTSLIAANNCFTFPRRGVQWREGALNWAQWSAIGEYLFP